jgi:hypothetical protein
MFARRVLFIDLLLKCMAKDFSVLNNGIVLIILHTGQLFNGCYSDELFFAYWEGPGLGASTQKPFIQSP